MIRFPTVVAMAFGFLTAAMPTMGFSQKVQELCNAASSPVQQYEQCVQHHLGASVDALLDKGMLCSETTCVIALRCAGGSICVDKGYTVKWDNERPEHTSYFGAVRTYTLEVWDPSGGYSDYVRIAHTATHMPWGDRDQSLKNLWAHSFVDSNQYLSAVVLEFDRK